MREMCVWLKWFLRQVTPLNFYAAHEGVRPPLIFPYTDSSYSSYDHG
jgi:hypothetical protein